MWSNTDREPGLLGAAGQREHIAGHQVRILRDEHQTSYAVPLSLEGLPGSAVRQVACGENLTMALLGGCCTCPPQTSTRPLLKALPCLRAVNGQVWVWGNDPSGQPIQETRLREFVIQVACGRAHMCAITGTRHTGRAVQGNVIPSPFPDSHPQTRRSPISTRGASTSSGSLVRERRPR